MSDSQYTVAMNGERLNEVVTALRSNTYLQGRGQLATITTEGVEYCCIGVMCDLAVRAGVISAPTSIPRVVGGRHIYVYDGETTILPASVAQWFGISGADSEWGDLRLGSNYASVWNDLRGKSFPEIADLFEKHVKPLD